MEQRSIGELSVSVVGLGCNNFGMTIDEERSHSVVRAALDAGITYFDTADIYGDTHSEEWLGGALRGHRDEVVIATKFGHRAGDPPDGRGGDPAWIRSSLEASLRRLGVETIDHYQLHQPDRHTPVAETLGALAELKAEGKIREIGCSNFDADKLDEAATAANEKSLAPFASVQNHYSVLTRTPDEAVLPACERLEMAFVPFFPLESGLLTGKYTSTEPPEGTRLDVWQGAQRERFLNDDRLAAVQRLESYAADNDHTILELALSWLVSHPTVASVIAGATRPDQVAANAAAATAWTMDASTRAEIVEAATG
ncbi:MAG: aldo/keto reductase [Acidimicrobiales bacterium]